MINVTSEPENQHSKHYEYVVLNQINVVYHLTKLDLSYDDYMMMWSTLSDRVTKHLKLVQNRPKSRF